MIDYIESGSAFSAHLQKKIPAVLSFASIATPNFDLASKTGGSKFVSSGLVQNKKPSMNTQFFILAGARRIELRS